jgi:hypothetical protein
MLSVVMLSVVMQSVIMQSVVIQSVTMQSVVMQNVIMLHVVAPRQGVDDPHIYSHFLSPPVPAAEAGLKPLTLGR